MWTQYKVSNTIVEGFYFIDWYHETSFLLPTDIPTFHKDNSRNLEYSTTLY